MTWNPASPVTGATVTGLTAPTYTLTADTAPEATVSNTLCPHWAGPKLA